MQPTPSRRHVLGAGLALPLALNLPASARSRRRPSGAGKSLLVLGGTRFLGPAIVDAALERGYEVTLFNRGKSNPHLYPDLEKLRGDRDTGDLAALEGREWDLVVDTSLYLPSHAKAMAELLAERVEHYVMISTISVYDTPEGPVGDENTKLTTISDEDTAKVTKIGDVMRVGGGRFYGPLKVRSEQQLEAAMPGRVTVLRPGVIAGRDDPSDRLPYWVVRVAQGGEILMPDPPDQGVQFTDARDLGVASVEFGAARTAGIFNTAGFAGKVTLQELVHGCKIVLGSDCSFTWASEEFLLENQVRPFSELPFWLPREWSKHWSNEKAIAAGMTFRPIGKTIQETWDWHTETRGDDYQWRYYGMQPEREADLLAKWHARGAADAEPPAEAEAPAEGD
jgi:2'-hydroxyisoflavone reductase